MVTPPDTSDTPQAAPALPPGLRLYAVGDVHGCRETQARLLARIAEDAAAAGAGGADGPTVRLVFLGDYVDRGPDPAGVVDDLLRVAREGLAGVGPVETVFLRGNHEDFLLRFLAGELETGEVWLMNGGAETLRSFGVDPPGLLAGGDELARAREELAAALEGPPRRFFEETALSHEAGDYLFVHAGVRPGVPLAAQRADDLMWIRAPFLEHPDWFGRYIVHGHTPVRVPDERANRLDLDTGACYGGDLTAGCFWGTERRFLQVGR